MDSTAEALKEKQFGDQLYRDEKYEDALIHYTNAIRLDGANYAYYANKAAAYLMLEEYELCVKNCDRAIELNLGHTKSFIRRGVAHRELNRFSQAWNDFREAVRREPKNQQISEEVAKLSKMEERKKSMKEGDKTMGYLARALQIAYSNDEQTQEKAINLLHQSLDSATLSFSNTRGLVLKEIGSLYFRRKAGSKGDNINTAIKYLKEAKSTFSEGLQPELCSSINKYLGYCFSESLRGEGKGENMEIAIEYFKNAISLLEKDKAPSELSSIFNSLGIAHLGRVKGERADNLREAEHNFSSALELIDPESVKKVPKIRSDWISIQRNMALACRGLAEIEQPDTYLERAEHAYVSILDVIPKDEDKEFVEALKMEIGKIRDAKLLSS